MASCSWILSTVPENGETPAVFDLKAAPMKLCIHCQHFRDGHYHKTYISPRCSVRGDDDCAYMRAHVCTLGGSLYEPKHINPALEPVREEAKEK